MKYMKGMKRYSKNEGKYSEDEKGGYYKAGDGKLYKMMAPTGVDKPGNKPGEADDHAHAHADDDPDYPGAGGKGGMEKKHKSMISEDDLNKTLDELDALVKSDDPASRREMLLAKAQSGEDLSDEERDELFKALGGDPVADADPVFSDDLTKGFQENDNLQQSLDVSEYLDEQHNELIKSLALVGDRIETSDRRQHDFNILLAKSQHQMGTLIKGMAARLNVIEEQPIRTPKSRGVDIPADQVALAKSFGGEPAEGTGGSLSKGEILDTMVDMMQKSGNGMAPCGEDINLATAKYEQMSRMSKGMLADVVEFRRSTAH